MSNGYLGKISAIVTANTGDFRQKLDGAAKDVSSFARSTQSTLSAASSASTKALRDIYTEAQKFDRAIKAATSQKLSFKGFDSASLQDAATKAKQLFSATSEVSKPLAAASKAFGKLSSDVQGGFLPALIAAQHATENLAATINKSGSISESKFERIKRRVDAAVESMSRLREADGLAGSLSTGRELAFQQPGMVAELARAKALQSKALGLAPEDIAGANISVFAAQQKAAADEAARLYSALERVRASRNGDTAAAEAAYNNQVAALGRVNTQLEEQISLSQQAAAAAKEAANIGAATDVRARLAAISSMERAAQEEAAYRSKAADQAEREAKAMAQVVERQNQSLLIEQNRRSGVLARRNSASFDDATEGLLAKPAAADPIFGSPGRSIQSEIARTRELYSQFLSLSPEVQASLEGERAKLDNIAKSAESGAASIGVLADANERMARTIGSFGEPSGPFGPEPNDAMRRDLRARRMAGGDITDETERSRSVDRIGQSIAATRGQIDTLPDGIRARFIPSVQQATDRFAELARLGPGATRAQIALAAREVERLAQAVGRAQGANAFVSQFGARGAAGIDFSLQSRSLQGYTAQLGILHQTLATVSTAARGPALASFDRLRIFISRAFAQGTLDAAGTRAEIQRLTREAVAATSAVARVRQGTLGRQVSRAGDIGRAGFGNAGLAIQQASFAVSDFMSSTGGLEFKVRAISNNIEQLGFVLGGTYGLVAAVGVSVAANVGIMAAKFMGLMDTQEQVNARSDALTEAFSRQKESVAELADAYSRFSAELREAILTKEQNLAIDRKQVADELRTKQKEAREATASATLPRIAVLQAERKEIEARKPSTVQEAQAKQADLQENQRRQARVVASNARAGQDALRNAGPAGVAGLLGREQARRDELLRRRGLDGADVGGIDRQLAGANTNIAAYSDALQSLKDEAAAAAQDGVGPLRDQIEAAVKSLDDIKSEFEDLVPPAAAGSLAAAATELQSLLDAAQGGTVTNQTTKERLAAIQGNVTEAAASISGARANLPRRRMEQDDRERAAQELEQSAARGRGLAITPGQKAGEELAAGLLDIQRAVANPQPAMERLVAARMRQQAPAIFGLADSVENAIMQGPSRSALQVSDVTTAQGASELNRLLRGDDSAKNQDLVELQKQSNSLQELVTIARQNGAPPGVFN